MDMGGIKEYLTALKNYEVLAPFIVDHREIPGKDAKYLKPSSPFSKEINKLLENLGISSLYSHQVEAIDLIRNGQHTVIATPTASGKTFIYNLPVIEKNKKFGVKDVFSLIIFFNSIQF